MLAQMKQLIEFFAARCSDRSTLDELHQMIGEQWTWHKAHDLFDRIRKKTLDAQRRKDYRADCQ
jgi:phage shock protein A